MRWWGSAVAGYRHGGVTQRGTGGIAAHGEAKVVMSNRREERTGVAVVNGEGADAGGSG